ncbi:putative tocopherol O-methyltransferase, chloroplastic [Ananas comosus]|uniref:Putative tocopherol O-methyltransferase, chloroplastic n=1 Tax=Ananas comosus TaxID=4615 RepID=A0A199UZ08_ANACO|nr:putative tocopherol O-methyltransferase, chloroplastic [Ananas comosus]
MAKLQREEGEGGDHEKLRKGIAQSYDESTGAWEELFGEYIHRGFYDTSSAAPGAAPLTAQDHRRAQLRMIDEALAFAGVSVADALNQPFPDGQFDLVWSLESGEHMPDKEKFFSEMARVAAPGATIILVTWCHRDLSPDEESLRPDEMKLLNKISDAHLLPAWCSAADYASFAKSLKLEDIRRADWSENVAPFWSAAVQSGMTWRGIISLLKSGWKTIKTALAVSLLIEGYNKKVIKYNIITCRKPK